MPNQSLALDRIFQALSDPTRRAVLQRLSAGSAAASDLSAPFEMALPSFMQHLRLLESCGLVHSTKQGRVRTYRIVPGPLSAAEGWLGEQRSHWEQRLNRLDAHLDALHASAQATKKEKKP